jgi:hypothetical protein
LNDFLTSSTALRACLAIIPAAVLLGCSPPSVVRTTPAVTAATAHASAALAEPAANEVVIVINNNAPPGNHSGIFAGNRLNDPAGSYVGTRSKDKDWPGPSLADYVEFQKEDGPRIQIYRFKLAAADFAALDARMAAAGTTPPLFCAVAVQNLIAGLGPFGNIAAVGWATPASLAELLDPLVAPPALAGSCVLPDNRAC